MSLKLLAIIKNIYLCSIKPPNNNDYETDFKDAIFFDVNHACNGSISG